MGNQFGCTAGERPEKGDAPEKNGGTDIEKPLLNDDNLAILLTPESLDGPPPPPAKGASVETFENNLTLAMSIGVMCVVLSLPMIVPSWNLALSNINGASAWMALIPGGVVLMTVFTVYSDLGNSLQLAYQGAVGTFIACAWSHVVSALMPYGAYGCDPKNDLECAYNPYLCNTLNCLLIVGSLWLNISKNVRMFILSYHVYFVMSIQDPETDPLMNTTWAINWTAQTTTTLFTALIGLAAAIVTIMLPSPRFAKVGCRKAAVTSVNQACDIVKELSDYYKGSAPSVRISKLEADAVALRTTVESMQAGLDAAWWEHYDIGKGGRIRNLLCRHVTSLKTLSDNVFAMQICISKEDFAKSHQTCMTKIGSQVDALLDASRELLTTATESAADGTIDKDEEADLRAKIDAANASIKDLAKVFNTTRKQMFPDKVINVDLQAESFFVYCLSIHARRGVDYATQMLDNPPKPANIFQQMFWAFKDIFNAKVLTDRIMPHGFTVRASLEMLISYYMGVYIFDFNAAASCTISLLLADFPGSAIIKNLGRLQAVVLAAIVPHIIQKIQGTSCDPFKVCLKAFSIFAWETLTNYIYISSPTYGYIGLLCAAFGLATLVYPCSHMSGAAQAAADDTYSFAMYQKILQTTYAVLIMMIVDMLLSPGRASDMATDSVLKSLMSIDGWFQAAFMARTAEGELQASGFVTREDIAKDKLFAKQVEKTFHGKRQPGSIMAHLSLAGALGAEADKEARYYRAPWPTAFFDCIVRKGHILRANLNMVEQVLEGSKSDSLYTDDFKSIRDSNQWKAVQNDVVNTFGDAIFMIQEVLHNEVAAPMADVAKKAGEMEGADKLESLPDLFTFINRGTLKYPAAATDTLEEDVICRINVILMLMDASNDEVAGMIKECLKLAK